MVLKEYFAILHNQKFLFEQTFYCVNLFCIDKVLKMIH